MYALSLQQEKSYVSDKVNLNLNIRNINLRRLRKCQNCYYLKHIYVRKKKKRRLAAIWCSQNFFSAGPSTSEQPIHRFIHPSVIFANIWVTTSWPLYSPDQSPNTYKHNTMTFVSQHRITHTINLLIPI